MKKGVHPDNYRPVVFQDSNDNSTIITRSTVTTDEVITIDGTEYPLVKLHISSSSHPYFTGEERIVDIEGRVDKFKARQAAAAKAREAKANAKPKAAKKMRIDETQKLGAAKDRAEKPGKAAEAKANAEDKPAEAANE